MPRIIVFHSFRRGTGKSNIVANVAAVLALQGQKVAVMDADLPSPSQHDLFELGESDIVNSLNDYVWGRCSIDQAAHTVTKKLGVDSGGGQLFVLPASPEAGDIARAMHQAFEMGLLRKDMDELSSVLGLDTLIIDTHAGLNEDTLMTIALADVLVVVLRPDPREYQGTAVTLDLAKNLEVPRVALVVNEVPDVADLVLVKEQVEGKYQADVIGVIPFDETMLSQGSQGLFVTRHPHHPLSDLYRLIAKQVQQ